MRLTPCPVCRSHVECNETRCVHCRAPIRTVPATIAVAMASLVGAFAYVCDAQASTGTAGTDGASTSETTAATSDLASSDGSSSTTDEVQSTAAADDSGGVAEPHYGAPSTGCSTAEGSGPAPSVAIALLLLTRLRRRRRSFRA